MPLRKGSSKATIEANTREMVDAGHPVNVAIAAAERMAGHGRYKKPEPKKRKGKR